MENGEILRFQLKILCSKIEGVIEGEFVARWKQSQTNRRNRQVLNLELLALTWSPKINYNYRKSSGFIQNSEDSNNPKSFYINDLP